MLDSTEDPVPHREERRSIVDRRRQRRHEQLQLREIVAQLADGIVIVGTDGNIRFANPAAEHLFGRKAADLVGTQFGFPLTNDLPAPIEVLRRGGLAVSAELRVVDISWEGIAAHLVSIRDVTERRRAEERDRQLERERAARAEAEAASQAKSDLVATMSHELRTPLNAVLGYADLLDLDIKGRLGNEQRTLVDRIRASGRHLLGLVDQLLDIAKVDAGQLSVQIDTFPARGTADAAAALIQPIAEARGIRLVERSADVSVSYAGDEERVRQILVNLLTNAVKFTGAGGTVVLEHGLTSEVDPDARLRGNGPWSYFRVADSGIGIPADQVTRIFLPFVQLDSGRTRRKDGTGLGLAISRRLARLMQGDITVRSSLGEGSAFTLWLPSSSIAQDSVAEATELAEHAAVNRGLADIGELLLHELEPLVEAFVARVRAECPIPGIESLKFSQLADHVASYLADLAGMLIVLDETAGQPSSMLADAVDIHRLVASRHGVQRAQLGWSEEAIRCEYDILRDEVDRVLTQHAHATADGVVDEVRSVLARFVEHSEQTSLRAFARVAGTAGRR